MNRFLVGLSFLFTLLLSLVSALEKYTSELEYKQALRNAAPYSYNYQAPQGRRYRIGG